ncbi:hypothetical protein ACMD47_001088 [Serratia marcescens]|uniref:hypothetical protein n=1 Tax=Serratia TaxID=613 RepID=UPI0027E4F93B|nr:hypothetical protein [Serratia marcescens]EMB4122216.1 hypothetical protein [Serratia marcescens]EMC1042442.1 hypothetical protein [Serratia marcescens]EMC1046664.1 hypothetical protein [Serratia marcescens]MDI3226597.1 hypothetical protein [Serratia marcescens]HBV0687791.1 hypothetical protein [Serratia marcescens]
MDDKGSPSFREHLTAFYCVAQRRTAAADERNIDPSPQKIDGVNRLNNRQKSDEQRFLLCQFAGRWATINSIKALGYPCRNAL